MKNKYDIIMVNKLDSVRYTETVEAICFSEAATAAFKSRARKGFDWNIISVTLRADTNKLGLHHIGESSV